MVCNGDCRMSPLVRPLYQPLTGCDCIHLRHICMAVQFHTFFGGIVHFSLTLYHDDGFWFQNIFPSKIVIADTSDNQQCTALFDLTKRHF